MLSVTSAASCSIRRGQIVGRGQIAARSCVFGTAFVDGWCIQFLGLADAIRIDRVGWQQAQELLKQSLDSVDASGITANTTLTGVDDWVVLTHGQYDPEVPSAVSPASHDATTASEAAAPSL